MAIKPACLLAIQFESPPAAPPESVLVHDLEEDVVPALDPESPRASEPPPPPQLTPDVPPPLTPDAPPLLTPDARPSPSPPPLAPAPAPSPPTLPSLPELARALRLQAYQRRRCQQLQRQLLGLQIAAAQTLRLARIAPSVRRVLAECIRSEDKASFVNLFATFHRALEDCTAVLARLSEDEWTEPERADASHSCFDHLTDPSRAAVTDFLSQIRCDGDFIADRIASLPYKDVLGLLPDRGSSRLSESVLGSSGPYSRMSRHLGYVVDSQAEMLESRSFGSTLEMLVHGVRGFSGSRGFEPDQGLEVWSTVCARLIEEQKPGSEKLVPAVLDIWAASAPWPGKERLELWILQTLRAGSFLLEQPSKQSFRMRIQARSEAPTDEDMKAENFYAQAVSGLLALLADPAGASVIPEPVLRMCRSIWGKLQSSFGHQRAFPHFVLTRWLFSPYFFNAVTLPEALGLVADHYIPENARQRILREVANRALKAVFDVAYSWKYGNVVSPELTARVEAVMSRFEGQSSRMESGVRDVPAPAKPAEPESFVVLSSDEIVRMVNALYPKKRTVSLSSDRYTPQSGLHSSASSISGLSLFRNAGTFDLVSQNLPQWPQDASQMLQPPPNGVSDSAQTLEPSLDTEQLREACQVLEDLQTPGVDTVGLWATFSSVHGTDGLRPAGENLCSAPTGSTESPRTPDGTSSLVIRCQGIIEQLLAEDLEGHALLPVSDRAPECYTVLLSMLEQRIMAAQDASDYVGAHAWFCDLRALRNICGEGANLDLLCRALKETELHSHRSLTVAEVGIDACEAWTRLAKLSLDISSEDLLSQAEVIQQMRDKMWYVADVRTSAAYDEARSVASALRVMGKPKRPSRARIAPPLRHWSGSKFLSASLHLKTEAQILELLSAPPEHGGPNKLSDEQARTTLQWMERNSIENLCRGEERLHRFCMEVRKCANQLTAGESALLSSNPLFTCESLDTEQARSSASPRSLASLKNNGNGFNRLTLQTYATPSIDGMSGVSHPLSSAGSRDQLDSRSPTLTHKSSAPFWSPAMTEAQSPSSTTSINSYHTQTAARLSPKKRPQLRTSKDGGGSSSNSSRLERLEHCLMGLLISDLTFVLFSEGSETDVAFWSGLGGTLTQKHLRSTSSLPVGVNIALSTLRIGPQPSMPFAFDFQQAFRRLLQSFAKASNPYTKLEFLYDIDRLLPSYMAEEATNLGHMPTVSDGLKAASNLLRGQSATPTVDTKVSGFFRLFCDSELRPAAIFRDLQYIAALLPASVLEASPQGKAFWNAAVAISDLRQQARNVMVETADSIIAYHSNNRGHGRTSSTAQQERDSATFSAPSRSSSAEEIAHHSMADAAYLLQITAKEGEPAAQRELATLYLTHPELMDHIIAPFSRPKEVFKEELENKWRKNQDPNKCDPTTMCVAHHWMSLSAKGSDALAMAYLRQSEEMDR